MKMDQEIKILYSKPRNANRNQKRIDCLLELSEETWFCGYLDFRLLASRTVR
jgi:hypothetical protein